VVVVAFTFMYWVQNFGDDGFETFLKSLYTIFARFVGGMSENSVDSVLDLIFGIVLVMILLNVLIAIVSNSWANAVQTSAKMLCRHRFELLEQVESLHIPPNYFVDFIHQPYDDDYEAFVEERIVSRVRLSLLGRETEKCDDEKSENYFRLVVWSAVYIPLGVALTVLPWFLGMFSFGLWWPRHIRASLFGMVRDVDQVITAHPEDSLESRIGRMENQIKQVNEEMNENLKQVNQQMQQMNQALKNVEQLLENQGKMMSPRPSIRSDPMRGGSP
jgi:hypothetical protein